MDSLVYKHQFDLIKISKILNMELIQSTQYHLALNIFDSNVPNYAFILAVIEETMPGFIFLDNNCVPHRGFILTNSGFAFLSKGFSNIELSELYNYLESHSKFSSDRTKLVLLNSCSFNELSKFKNIKRIYFDTSNEMLEINSEDELNLPFSLSQIDESTFELCNWKDIALRQYGNKSNYLKLSAGFCLMNKGKVISEAHAVVGGDFSELGVITSPEFRRKGLSSIVCRALMKHFMAKNYQLRWSCNADNSASIKLAKSLGFQPITEYLALTP